jgi:hypothetical protein
LGFDARRANISNYSVPLQAGTAAVDAAAPLDLRLHLPYSRPPALPPRSARSVPGQLLARDPAGASPAIRCC